MEGLDRIVPEGAGALGLYSSDEFFSAADGFDTALLGRAGERVGLVFCADHRNAKFSARNGIAHFTRLGARPFVLDLHDQKTDDVDLVYIAGGNPAALLACMQREPKWQQLKQRWRAGELALAGSSAGAMMLCAHATIPHAGDTTPTHWTTTEGVISEFAVAVHASSRGSKWLQQLALRAPVHILALPDRTGVLMWHGGAYASGPDMPWFI